jgi:hypothetical protein
MLNSMKHPGSCVEISMLRKLVLLVLIAILCGKVAQPRNQCEIIVLGKVLSVGENPRMIGGARIPVYWLAKYSIVDVLRGHLSQTEIDVAHFVLIGNELENLRVGNKVLLCIKKRSKKIRDAVLPGIEYEGELLLVESSSRKAE